jgi:hypothetical protein
MPHDPFEMQTKPSNLIPFLLAALLALLAGLWAGLARLVQLRSIYTKRPF